jgi:hypothetical protein
MVKTILIGGALGMAIGAFGAKMFTADTPLIAAINAVFMCICIAAYFANLTRRPA